jgi:mRNA-degrading endonuclease RelE of RelBE toxin-antitoxin system
MEPAKSRCTVELSRDAKKDLKKLRPHLAQVLRAIAVLETDPHAGHTLTGVLHGLRALAFTVKGSGAFRAVYGVLDDGTVCLIVVVGPHENIYDKAERRVEALRAAGVL